MRVGRSTILALACVATAGLACSSSLEEFRCTLASECGDEGLCVGGYCAYEDPVCPQGLRYGEASGEDSNRCVGDPDSEGDGGTPPTPPVASIAPMDTSFIPRDMPHRFLNIGDGPLKILWSYAAAEVTRTFTETGETVPHLSSGDKV